VATLARWSRALGFLAALLLAGPADALDEARRQMGVDKVHAEMGLTGRGVLLAVIDRGLDYTHPALRSADGSTRLHAIFDLTDPSGAKAEDNVHGAGTIHDRAAIDRALRLGEPLGPRDEEGRGTTSVGLAGGNGAGSPELRYRGIAPEATLLFVKIAVDKPPDPLGEVTGHRFFDLSNLRFALDYCVAQAETLDMPLVMLMNFAQIGGPTDGTSRLCRRIDDVVGPGIPGRVFVSGPGDKGDRKNRARGRVPQGGSLTLPVFKDVESEVFVDIWYPDEDRFTVTIRTPTGTFGPYEAPKIAKSEYTKEFQYYHLGHERNAYRSGSAKRQIRIDLVGAPGRYDIVLRGAKVSTGAFHAFVGPNPSNPLEEPFGRFEAHVTPGSIWDGATAKHAICPGSYVLRTGWKTRAGRSVTMLGEGEPGELWLGSGTGPTLDGREGVDLCAPADRVAAPYARASDWAGSRRNLISDDGALYGLSGGTGAAGALVAGVVALMLQLDPTLDAVQVRQILRETARADEHTGEVPNERFGHGKIDAYAALQRAKAVKETRAPGDERGAK
jgi:subtilisin family serine protease